MKSYEGKPVTFVEFDFTTDETKGKAKADAKKHGLTEIFDKRAPGTGFVLVIDGKTKKVVGELKASNSVDDWKAAVDKILSS